jgi:hypothetical protein
MKKQKELHSFLKKCIKGLPTSNSNLYDSSFVYALTCYGSASATYIFKPTGINWTVGNKLNNRVIHANKYYRYRAKMFHDRLAEATPPFSVRLLWSQFNEETY